MEKFIAADKTRGLFGKAKSMLGLILLFKTFIQNLLFIRREQIGCILFMGLRDKNDKLIYFGDILKDEYNNLLTPVCEVLKDEHILFFKPVKHLNKKIAIGCKSTYSNTLEVVGNVHNNLELFKMLFTI